MKKALSNEFCADLQSAYGLFCLWDAKFFRHIRTADDWDRTFSCQQQLERYIHQRHLVPIYFYGYGHYYFEVRAIKSLTEQELAVNPLISQPYCIHSGGYLALSGVEYIGSTKDAHYHRVLMKTKPGDYQVRIALLAGKDTAPKEERFIDAVVLLENIVSGEIYRTSASTFYPI